MDSETKSCNIDDLEPEIRKMISQQILGDDPPLFIYVYSEPGYVGVFSKPKMKQRYAIVVTKSEVISCSTKILDHEFETVNTLYLIDIVSIRGSYRDSYAEKTYNVVITAKGNQELSFPMSSKEMANEFIYRLRSTIKSAK